MPAVCPHCNEALSTYMTSAESKPTNVEVLVCAHCDKFLGVVGLARAEGARIDVDEIADLLSVAVDTDDEGEARTVFSIAIGKIDSGIEEGGGAGIDVRLLERVLSALFYRQDTRNRKKHCVPRMGGHRDQLRPARQRIGYCPRGLRAMRFEKTVSTLSGSRG